MCIRDSFLVVRGFPVVTRRLAVASATERVELSLSYRTRRGVLGRVLELCTRSGFQVTDVRIHAESGEREGPDKGKGKAKEAGVVLSLEGRGSAHPLVEELTDWEGILDVDLRSSRDSTE